MKINKLPVTNSLRDRIDHLIKAISTGMYEREEVIAVSLLAALCGQNTFLYGPPGTAKSLISRRLSCAFHNKVYFEYLMNRFSTPEEVFGPVSIKALKEDHYIRKTDSYLPKADFAFLDEIWKSSPAILNTLLTLINERVFKNGETIEQVPLKALLAASNETPDINQGLEALYDRFIVRLMVQPISELEHFELLLSSKPSLAEANVSEGLRIKSEEWDAWLQQIHSVALSSETLTIIHLIREKISELDKSSTVYVSDRRWQRAAILMKAAAFFNGRAETNHSDALLLEHCIWTHESNYKTVQEIVRDAVKQSGIDSGISLADIDRKKDALDAEINDELFHSSDIYKTEKIGGREFLKFSPNFYRWNDYNHGKQIYISVDKIKSKDKFIPVDQNGNELNHVDCQFHGQGTCKIHFNAGNRDVFDFKPDILFHKGDRKEKVNDRLIKSLSIAVSEIKNELQSALKVVIDKFSALDVQLTSLFVPTEKSGLAIAGISEQIENLKLRIKDCERLEELCQ
ncbi:AAA family ATPase [Azonexus hydrophilus]|uniref:AAA family ATPase n=1 Tax=Azonexus hydrophilus TaxID=418702 RepID=A0ABZ2XC49_9RHOO